MFTKTRILSVKVATLTTFLSMVKTLDQVTVYYSIRSYFLRRYWLTEESYRDRQV